MDGILKLVRDSFRGLIQLIFILIVVACTVMGVVWGNDAFFEGGAIIGGLIGGLAGVIIVIIGGGYIATILNIDENLEKIVKSLDKGESVKEENSKAFDGREESELDILKKKMKPNQCIVLVKETSKLAVWDKAYWEKIVKEEVDEYYELVYTNY